MAKFATSASPQSRIEFDISLLKQLVNSCDENYGRKVAWLNIKAV